MESGPTFVSFLMDYWWLVFPLAYFVGAGWDSWMKLRRHQASLDLLKSYAASGTEPPASLLNTLNKGSMADELGVDLEDSGATSWRNSAPFLVILMAGLAAVFAYAGYTGMLDLGEEAYFVALILGVLGLAFWGAALFSPKGK